jgi:hypothetical protein
MENFEGPGLPKDEQSKFSEEYRNQAIPADLEDRTVQELKRRGLFRRSSPRILKPALSLLLVGILFSAGFFLGKNNVHSNNSVPANNLYLLLLYNAPNSLESKSHAKEYAQWFKSIDNKAIGGDELKNGGWSLMANNKPLPINALEGTRMATGYFIIQSNSEAEALRLAATCPHLKYNGQIEVRPIQSH